MTTNTQKQSTQIFTYIFMQQALLQCFHSSSVW